MAVKKLLEEKTKFKKSFSLASLTFFTLCLLSFLILLTPFSNYLARPLVVPPEIKKADVILVLSGGSYDNGQLSSFSLERTIQAVRLYKEGLAPKIIFSGKGGWPHQEDAVSMGELAESLGVEKDDLLIERESSSTYENILFSTEVARKNNFQKILLVTSPIHLRRSLGIAQKLSCDLEFIPASFPSYDAFRRHPLDRLILFWFTVREYLGILREYFRG